MSVLKVRVRAEMSQAKTSTRTEIPGVSLDRSGHLKEVGQATGKDYIVNLINNHGFYHWLPTFNYKEIRKESNLRKKTLLFHYLDSFKLSNSDS